MGWDFINLEGIDNTIVFFNWIKSQIDSQHEFSNIRLLLILDIIGVTGKLNGLRNITDGEESNAIQTLQQSIFSDFDYALGLIEKLSDINGVEINYEGNNGDRIDITGNTSSIILLSLILKTSHIGRNLRMIVLKEGGDENSDWLYTYEDIGNKRVPKLILDHSILNMLPTKDTVASMQSILLSPSLFSLHALLQYHNIIDFNGVPNINLRSLFSPIYQHVTEEAPSFEVCSAVTVIIRSGIANIPITRRLAEGLDVNQFDVNCDYGRKQQIWATLKMTSIDRLLGKAFELVTVHSESRIFISPNQTTLFATMRNGQRICIDPFATSILSKILKSHEFAPGLYLFNTLSPEFDSLKISSMANHLGVPETYYYYHSFSSEQ